MKRSERLIIDTATAKVTILDQEAGNYLARVLHRKSIPSSEYWYCRGLIDGYNARGILTLAECDLMSEILGKLVLRGS